MENKRIVGIDIIKCLAVIFVMSIHQIGMTHVQADPLVGLRPFVITAYRYMVMSCVPLFMMTTGYLQSKKEPNTQFFKGIIPILASYLFSSLFIAYINVKYAGESFNLHWIIIHILNFSENNYAWYVEMFIGLFLLIPFINKMYHALGSREQKKTLIGIMIFLTVIPGTLLVFNHDDFYYDVFPDYWTAVYPVTYYLMGAYVKEYKPRPNRFVNFALLILAILFPTVAEFIKANGGTFVADVFNGFNSLSSLFITVTLFLLLYDADISFKPVKLLIKDISVSTLEIYLWSNGIEKLLYPRLPETFPMRLFVMIALVFVCSYIPAKAQRLLFCCAERLLRRRSESKSKLSMTKR